MLIFSRFFFFILCLNHHNFLRVFAYSNGRAAIPYPNPAFQKSLDPDSAAYNDAFLQKIYKMVFEYYTMITIYEHVIFLMSKKM